MMCAEAVPWRCHRSLVGDALLVRGVRVEHIVSGRRRRTHLLTPFARVRGTRITYPPGAASRGDVPAKTRKKAANRSGGNPSRREASSTNARLSC